MRKYLELGGALAAVVLIGFGVAAIVMGLNGRSEVQTALKQQAVKGTPDMTPTAIAAEAQKAGLNPASLELPTCTAANKTVDNGSTARCFASYMRIHALEQTSGKTYSQMPRYASANGQGTNEASAALKDEKGKPVENPARNVWVTETALSTALNASYMGEQMALFGVVVGIALLLAGIGFAILTAAGALRNPQSVFAVWRKHHEHGAPIPAH
jgi:putative Mn2+ efflux pump MntP